MDQRLLVHPPRKIGCFQFEAFTNGASRNSAFYGGHVFISPINASWRRRGGSHPPGPQLKYRGHKIKVCFNYLRNCQCCLVAQSCPTLCNPMDYTARQAPLSMGFSPPGSSVHGVLQARILEWVAMPFSRGSIFPTQGWNPGLLHCRQILYCLSYQ